MFTKGEAMTNILRCENAGGQIVVRMCCSVLWSVMKNAAISKNGWAYEYVPACFMEMRSEYARRKNKRKLNTVGMWYLNVYVKG